MSAYTLIQTEKSYKLQQLNIYTLVFKDKSFSPNKIEVTQLLKSEGYNPLQVTVVKLPSKSKTRGKSRRKVLVNRPPKYLVKLKPGEQIKKEEE